MSLAEKSTLEYVNGEKQGGSCVLETPKVKWEVLIGLEEVGK